MKILVLGADGYIGTALMQFLTERGHQVKGIDNGMRVRNVASVGAKSLTTKIKVDVQNADLKDYGLLISIIKKFEPEAIVHLAEQPSAPFSMIDFKHAHDTQINNIGGTLNVLWAMREACPEAHLIKLGTEGEYPDWIWDGKHIPEGSRLKVGMDGGDGSIEEWKIPMPRYGGSWYHLSKLHDSMNIDYACRIWGLTATDVNQGIVYGNRYGTRLDYDEYFGTVVHRFAVQAVAGEPLTVYGTGGQTRGFIALQNSIEAIELLALNPPEKGEFRVIHQTTKEHSVVDVAQKIQKLTGCDMVNIENPRAEMESNHFTFDNSTLLNLGLKPITMDEELPKLLEIAEQHKGNIDKKTIKPKTKWN